MLQCVRGMEILSLYIRKYSFPLVSTPGTYVFIAVREMLILHIFSRDISFEEIFVIIVYKKQHGRE